MKHKLLRFHTRHPRTGVTIDRWVRVSSYAEASKAWETYRDSDYFGGGQSDCLEGNGDIESPIGEHLARVSYNGRIWLANGKEYKNENA